MKAFSRLWSFVARLRFLPARRRLLDEVTEELESHVELLATRYARSGMNHAEARLAAKRQLGNITRVREDIYTMNSIEWLGTVAYDVRYACRLLTKNPGFSLAAITTLAFAISANAVAFGLLNALILRPLNVPNPDSLYGIETGDSAFGYQSYPDYLDFSDRNQSFDGLSTHSVSRIVHWARAVAG